MRQVPVKLGDRSYDILIAPRLLKDCGKIFKQRGIGKHIFLVSNTTVFELHGAALVENLSNTGFEVTQIFIPDGERFKNLHTVENVYTYLIAQRADRFSTIAALGGGVTGDIAGFVAATFLRGIPYVQIPTTLLAQVDSSVGGKTGVNHSQGKNMVGVFYQPNLVCIDPITLATLPAREYRSGLYEVIKYGLIYDSDFFDLLEGKLDALKDREPGVLEAVVSRCCEIKAEITSIDERESGLRGILNFGHTFGHALEAVLGFHQLTHGEAVAYGMLAASRLSMRLGHITGEQVDRISAVIGRVGPLPPVDHVESHELLEAMERDKKRQEGRLFFVVLTKLGKAELRGDLTSSLIADVWRDLASHLPH